ncbi:hypothetical protein AXG93_1593s1140 [Marchantia polymorpha subsp. ruderalis]|uniref:LUC7 related protein n=1 Tax=Marchantia polymorpha subsp. ruderalis TaxID=1480154 RepID=A0A176WNV6_MARPO|nr:hypothetical protein AXG93_1593s1140 [Marchantia polymorpha subsp. ruderalis]
MYAAREKKVVEFPRHRFDRDDIKGAESLVYESRKCAIETDLGDRTDRNEQRGAKASPNEHESGGNLTQSRPREEDARREGSPNEVENVVEEKSIARSMERKALPIGEMDSVRKQLDALMGAHRNGGAVETPRAYNDGRHVCRLFLSGLCSHDLFQNTNIEFQVEVTMDAFRKQLDALMGANRNGDVREVKRKYYDRDVCRLYLTGLCPHDLFQLTKMDLGPCSKIHSLQLRKEYEEAKAKGKDNYDRELEDCLEKHIVECDRKIARALKRLEDDDAGAATAIAVSEVTKSAEAVEYTRQIKEKLKEAEYMDLEGRTDDKIRMMEQVEELRSKRADRQAMSLLEAFNKDRALMPQPLPNPPPLAPLPTLVPLPPDARTQEMIKEKLKKAEELGELGMVDEAQKAMEEAEALKKLGARQEAPVDPAKLLAPDVRIADQKLRVCDICGAFLSIYDSDRRLADHFGGKLHLGYMQIREKLVDLREERMKVRKPEVDGDDEKSREKSRERSVRATSRDVEREKDGERLDHDPESDQERKRGVIVTGDMIDTTAIDKMGYQSPVCVKSNESG